MNPTQTQQFKESLSLIFLNWTALRLSLQHSHITQQLHDDFKSQLETWFLDADGDIDSSDLENYMQQVVQEDLEIDMEDGSVKQVAEIICGAWGRIRNKGEGEKVLSELHQQKGRWQGKESQKEASQSLSLEDFGIDIGTSSGNQTTTTTEHNNNQQQQENDAMEDEDDGWTTVPSKKR